MACKSWKCVPLRKKEVLCKFMHHRINHSLVNLLKVWSKHPKGKMLSDDAKALGPRSQENMNDFIDCKPSSYLT